MIFGSSTTSTEDIAKIVEEATKKAFQDATKDSPIMVKKVEPEVNDNINVENNESEEM